MEIKKESINLTERSVKLNSNVMVETDIIVPDIKPDIGEVLLADASCVTDSVVYRNGKLNVSGTVFFKILYRPDSEEAGELKSLNSSFGFSDSFGITSDEEPEFFVSASTEHIGFTLVNSRKLSVKVIVALDVGGYRQRHFEPVSSVSGSDIQCREKRYNIYMPTVDVQSDISVSDLLTVPADMPDIDEILKVDAWVTSDECKVMNGKVMVKGNVHLKTLYTAVQGTYTTELVSHQIPFTEIAEAENVDENSDVCVTFGVKDISASARGDMNGDTKIINAELLISARVKASKSVQETICDDCYGIHGKMDIKTEKIRLLECVSSENAEFTETQYVQMPKNVKIKDVVNVTLKPILREMCFEEDGLHVRGTLVSFLLYREDQTDGRIKSAVTESDFEWQKSVSGQGLSTECELWVEDAVVEKSSADTAEVKGTLGMNVKILQADDVNIITDCEVVEAEASETGSSGLVIYFTENGDTLWNVAKKYGTTVDKIRAANHLEASFDAEDKLTDGKKLLIPWVC